MTYSSILRRYLATAIDSIFIIVMLFTASYAFQQEHALATQLRAAVIVFMFFVYEPLCTSMLCTVGQKMTGIRVRRHGLSGDEKISLPRAYLRIVSKLFLGFISFFTLPFSRERSAVHDFIAGSVVLDRC